MDVRTFGILNNYVQEYLKLVEEVFDIKSYVKLKYSRIAIGVINPYNGEVMERDTTFGIVGMARKNVLLAEAVIAVREMLGHIAENHQPIEQVKLQAHSEQLALIIERANATLEA